MLTELTILTLLLGNFKYIEPMQKNTEQKALTKCLTADKGYTQLITRYTTDYHTQIDHVYTNVPQCVQSVSTLESYYRDHKSIYISMKAV